MSGIYFITKRSADHEITISFNFKDYRYCGILLISRNGNYIGSIYAFSLALHNNSYTFMHNKLFGTDMDDGISAVREDSSSANSTINIIVPEWSNIACIANAKII